VILAENFFLHNFGNEL